VWQPGYDLFTTGIRSGRSSLCGMYGVILSGCGSEPVCSDVLFTTVAFKVGVAAVGAMITLMGVARM